MPKKSNDNTAMNDNESFTDQTYYTDWRESLPEKESRTVDILSSGILRQKDFSLLFEKIEKFEKFEKEESHAEQNNIPVIEELGLIRRRNDRFL